MTAFIVAAVCVAAVAAVYDLRTGHIPNWLTLGALAFAVAAHGGHGFAFGGLAGAASSLVSAVVGALACGLVPGIVFAAGGMGGGDVKLFAAIGAACHTTVGLEAETYSFLAALVLAPAYLAWRGTLLSTLANTAKLVTNPFRAKASRREVPAELLTWFRLAPAIFLGCVLTLALRVAPF